MKDQRTQLTVAWILVALLVVAVILLVLFYEVLPNMKNSASGNDLVVVAGSETTPVPDEDNNVVSDETPTPEPTLESAETLAPLPTETLGQNKPLQGTGFSEGDTIYDFTIPLLGGGEYTLSEHLDKPVLINIFATWCGPCIGEMPSIQQIYEQYGQEFNIIIINLAEDEAVVQQYVNDNKYTMTFGLAPFDGPWPDEYFIEYIPQSFIISTDGTILNFIPGSADHQTFEQFVQNAIEASP